MHTLPQFWDLTFILRTRFNQHQTIVDPIAKWLRDHGVQFKNDTVITDIALSDGADGFAAAALTMEQTGRRETAEVPLPSGDLVFLTNGSQVSNMTVGDMQEPVPPEPDTDPWSLWRALAGTRSGLGDPGTVADNTGESTWLSFTVTDRGRRFAERMEALSGREAGRGGLMTLRGANWLMTITRFHHPNVVDQPDDVFVWWGFGIFPERPGNLSGKSMFDCTGEEILREALHHLKFDDDAENIVSTSICRPSYLPYGNAIFLYRHLTDRPPVVPPGSRNLAFIGQFCEQPGDAVFTMEYSVRSAWTAVHRPTGKGRPPPAVYKG